jgi:hypothetical protein
MNERCPKIRVACAVRNPYFRASFRDLRKPYKNDSTYGKKKFPLRTF